MVDACVTTCAIKLASGPERESEYNHELIMNCTKIVDASGEVPEADLVPAVNEAANAATAALEEILPPALAPTHSDMQTRQLPDPQPEVAVQEGQLSTSSSDFANSGEEHDPSNTPTAHPALVEGEPSSSSSNAPPGMPARLCNAIDSVEGKGRQTPPRQKPYDQSGLKRKWPVDASTGGARPT